MPLYFPSIFEFNQRRIGNMVKFRLSVNLNWSYFVEALVSRTTLTMLLLKSRTSFSTSLLVSHRNR